jgi:hypothetical protein
MPLGRRPLALLALVPLVGLVAGWLLLGGGARARAVPAAAEAGCAQKALKYIVTDDPAEVARQNVFERSGREVTAPGFYTRPQPSTPTLHAAWHRYVVVFYRPGLAPAALGPLRALAAAASEQAPVIVVPRAQARPLVAIGLGQQLTCAEGGSRQVARVRAFAAAISSSLQP